ncbi:hypothetical protein QJS66_03540 [Kocuria rhizophila]|nr:hypothetical protein QJS66_03540 [Kocuria rhizophila]
MTSATWSEGRGPPAPLRVTGGLAVQRGRANVLIFLLLVFLILFLPVQSLAMTLMGRVRTRRSASSTP